ncbi:hypothetical protein QR680_001179 [Steinernema hermaphroditum]|uniref:Uncharacterized protein n=1 Tax=Steinernema hermaphroditum TaxID=289476 RepID=A0AA39GZZ4_9BILA|nr:hypothetical protein QR680_001179 [Steinernema hermaphroditum]
MTKFHNSTWRGCCISPSDRFFTLAKIIVRRTDPTLSHCRSLTEKDCFQAFFVNNPVCGSVFGPCDQPSAAGQHQFLSEAEIIDRPRSASINNNISAIHVNFPLFSGQETLKPTGVVLFARICVTRREMSTVEYM